MDLAELVRASGGDGREEVEQARQLLASCGADVYLQMPQPSTAPVSQQPRD